MNLLYFTYQLIAAFFLIMAGIAVANFVAFDLSQLLEKEGQVVIPPIREGVEHLYHHAKFGLIMWVSSMIISLTITFSRQLWLGYPLLIGLITLLFIFTLYQLNSVFFMQRWVVRLFGYQQHAYLFNFLLCMLASYWLFRRSSYIAKKQTSLETNHRDDILDADF